MLFLVWLGISFLVVALINLYLRHFGFPRRSAIDGRVTALGSSGLSQFYSGGPSTLSQNLGLFSSSPITGEPARWINGIFTWIYQQMSSGGLRTELIDSWLRSLTEHTENQSEVKIKFDDIHGSLPEFSNFCVVPPTSSNEQHGASTLNALTLQVAVTAKDITLPICVLSQTVESSRLIYADVYLLHLQGQLKVIIYKPNFNGETPIQISFVSAPELRLQILPNGRLEASTNLSSVEKVVRAAICDAVVRVTWSSSGGFRNNNTAASYATGIGNQQQQHVYTSAMSPSGQQQNQQQAFGATPQQQGFSGNQQQQQQQQQLLSSQFSQPLQQQQQLMKQQQQSVQSQQQYGSPSNVMSRTNDMTAARQNDTMNNRISQRLLVKIIKANGLADDMGSCNAYCVTRVDQPSQNFMTNVVRNTVNPVWDEQFFLDIDNFTRQIHFDVLDRDKQPDSELLGKVSVQLDEIRRMPSSRQILPLTGRLRSMNATSGSVTVEFALMDVNDFSRMPVNENNVLNQTMQPLNASQANNAGSLYNDPTMKQGVNSGELSQYQNRLSAHDMALSQQGGNRQQESPTFLVTGTDLQRSNVHGTVDAHGTLDGRGRGRESKESFASALKKRLTRGGGKKRSQSADRDQPHSQSLHQTGSHLRPPGDTGQDMALDDTMDRKVRSNSFTSSLRRIFKPTAAANSKKDRSREGSLTRNTPGQQQQQQQQLGYNYDRSLRQSTPVPPGADQYGGGQTSPGATQRTVDQYGTMTLSGGVGQQGSGSTSGSLTVGRY